ncbi:hypothetical protein D0809_20975 [Flavobacterium circumlabens]|uniref:RHS repeat-associated protein n=1 Tax=Flavobacterium circumlabens TaxID=2133765 RepID=A0A4Y7U7H7_9FLAO|nr:RHS repeat-associated core domain-containing protein [Flavobacterium circumlabens]TCN53076.1 RHS repeat-associated protein [Flavobacterium circumlabens]TEB42370.1 hypothetical protein D0809_20975 [Flavobacterium circumlabens]
MKQFYFSVLFFSLSLFTFAQVNPTGVQRDPGITDGDLSVSLSGGASYSIPIAAPPGINGVVPEISLSYNSQGGNGPAGYGWNISGISTISRIPATKFHDGKIDAVDFNILDRFAIDGQRLIIKNGPPETYGLNGTVYETENFSNLKVTSYGVHPNGANFGPAYFLVEYPDGSKAYYGNSTDSRSITEWSVTYWENAQGIRISYNYSLSNNLLEIASIKYGTKTTTTPINEIQFTYEAKNRFEDYYVGGLLVKRVNRLKEIKSKSNSVGFRSYVLEYAMAQTSEKYDRVFSITEKSGDNTKSYNPTVFSYNNTDTAISYVTNPNVLNVENASSTNASAVSGDFDGDGNMDFILYPTTGSSAKAKYWLFSGISANTGAQTIPNMGLAIQEGLFEEILPVTWLSWNNKLMYNQGWTVVKTNTTTNVTSLKTYSTDPSTFIYPQDEKLYTFPKFTYYSEHPLSCTQNRPPTVHTVSVPKRYITGDFNGDGLSDVIAIEVNFTYSYLAPCDANNQPLSVTDTYFGNSYFINLDRRITSNFANIAGNLNVFPTSKVYVADFNGDGKSDIYIFDAGKVRVYSVNDNKLFVLLYQSPASDSTIVVNKPIVMGDYNGDGKYDFMIPQDSNVGWYRYMSTGVSFVKEARNITSVMGNDSNNSYNYIATDYDNDGKNDLTIIKNSVNSSTGLGTIQVTAITEMGPTSFNVPTATTAARADINIYALPIALPTGDKQRPRFEIAFINNNKLHFFNSKKDANKDRLLTSITTGNGVQQFISYQPLDQIYEMYNNSIYTPSQGTELYPYFDIVAFPDFQIVTKLEKKSATVSKMKLYGYYGAVTNYEGLGFMGFRSIMESNWHDSNNPALCTVTNRDFKKRGAVTESYFLPYLTYPYSVSPSSYTTKSVFSYTPVNEQDALQSNKVFKLQNTGIVQYNDLENTSTETTTSYNENNNPLLTQKITKEGSTVIETEMEGIEYENPNPTTPYIIDRPYSKGVSKQRGSTISGYAEMYQYNASNLLEFSENYAYGTQASDNDTFSEIFNYDSFGNLTKKTITGPYSSPRETSYEYDLSGRFMTKVTDNDNLSATYEYDINNGMLKKETNKYGLSKSYTYDVWFKPLTVKDDQLNKTISYAYTNTYSGAAGSETTVTATTDAVDGSATEEKFDDLGRRTKFGVKDVNGTYSYVSYLYDIYDRIYKTSEPYFGSSPSKWNETKFDIYSRPTQNILFNNRSVLASYNGLTSTITDGQIVKSITKNAVGDVVSTNETTGGTINMEYFPGGNLKKTSYNGISINVEQNGWGKKTKQIDPSAGTFTYKYNDFGELIEDTSQNGNVKTTIVRDNSGRPIQKTVVGGGTNNETFYTYNSDKLPSTISFEDKNEPVGTNKIITTIAYDNTKRVMSVEENKIGVSKFTKSFTYDAIGRVATETKLAEIAGKSSSVTTKNAYKFGSLYQILDSNNRVIWQANTVNAKGQLLESITGNGVKTTNAYNTDGYLTSKQFDKTTGSLANLLTLTTAFDKNTDNLDSRTNSGFNNFIESFKYDEIKRLTEYTNKQGLQQVQTYAASGNILQNNLGSFKYDPVLKYQNTSIDPSSETRAYFISRDGIFYDDLRFTTGWNLNPHNPQCISTDGIGVKFSMNLAGDGVCYVQSDAAVQIDNAVDTEYTFEGYVTAENTTGQLTLFQYNANETGYYSYVSSASSAVQNGSSKIQMTVLVPASVKSLRLRLDGIGSGTLRFSNVKIKKTGEPSEVSVKKLTVTYNGLKTPNQIEEIGLDKISFTYNNDNQRSTMYYGGFQQNKILRPLRKHYSADGTMEIKENIATGSVEFVTYVGGDGYDAPIAVKSNGTSANQFLYLHRDYQGSIVAISDDTGSVVEKRLFDAWGSILKVTDGAGNALYGLTVLDRGYTGHEHLQSVGLINMNARLYDPKLHRFLQADNYIQDVTNSQNYNQYGYVYNNPLTNTDLSGDTCDCPGGGGGGGSIGVGPGTETGSSFDWKQFDKDYRISEWFKKNINGDQWSDAFKDAGNFLSNNFKSVGNSISNAFKSVFGHKSKSTGPPPNMSKMVELTKGINIRKEDFSYTSTHQTGQKGQFNSGVGDQLKIKTYIGLRIGQQSMFEVNDTFFNRIDEGRNYQFNLGRYSLNFRPKDYRVRYMYPDSKNVSQGFSLGNDGVGWHYNVRNGNGRNGGYDVAFKPGGYTMMLVGGIILSILQPEAAPAVTRATEEIIAHSYQLAY